MKTLGRWNRLVDFTKVCKDCSYCEADPPVHPVCNVNVDVVTGARRKVDCRAARSMVGYCGPEGRHFSPRAVTAVDVELERVGDAAFKVAKLEPRKKGAKK